MLSSRRIIVAVVSVLALVTGIYFALPNTEKNFARIEIKNVSISAEVAETQLERIRGLSGRPSLPAYGGMLFLFDAPGRYGIWMKDMRFPIDILWIRNGVVVDIEEHAPPPKANTPDQALPVYEPEGDADMVLEVQSGFASTHDIVIGDEVAVSIGGQALSFSRIAESKAHAAITPPPLPTGYEYTIESLRAEPKSGSHFQVGDKKADQAAYRSYSLSYESDGLTISGMMNVPNGTVPAEGFPILILNHGLIRKEIYVSGRGSKREQDFFARHGYVTIHPDYRGLASSTPVELAHHDFYVGYSRDVSHLVDAIKDAKLSFMDTSRIGMWGHSMGGGITARIMTLRNDIRAYVLFAPISANAEENFYELSAEEIAWLHGTYGEAGAQLYGKISPLEYFQDVAAPVQIHHGTADHDVPISFSETMAEKLKSLDKKVEFFMYPEQKHEFIEDWPVAAERALQFFDYYVKNTH